VSCAKTAEPVDLPFWLWTRVSRRKHKFNRIRQVAPMCPHGMAHWRHVVNTIEPSVCGDDAVLRQITLTTCCIKQPCDVHPTLIVTVRALLQSRSTVYDCYCVTELRQQYHTLCVALMKLRYCNSTYRQFVTVFSA